MPWQSATLFISHRGHREHRDGEEQPPKQSGSSKKTSHGWAISGIVFQPRQGLGTVEKREVICRSLLNTFFCNLIAIVASKRCSTYFSLCPLWLSPFFSHRVQMGVGRVGRLSVSAAGEFSNHSFWGFYSRKIPTSAGTFPTNHEKFSSPRKWMLLIGVLSSGLKTRTRRPSSFRPVAPGQPQK